MLGPTTPSPSLHKLILEASFALLPLCSCSWAELSSVRNAFPPSQVPSHLSFFRTQPTSYSTPLPVSLSPVLCTLNL